MKNANRLGLLVAALLAASTAYAQSPSSARVVILPQGTNGIDSYDPIGKYPHLKYEPHIAAIGGWLVCNGARAKKSDYPALAAKELARNPSRRDPDPDYFRLPSMPLQYKDGKLYSGYATNPFPIDPYHRSDQPGVLAPFVFAPSI
jgi:hypothetical protein